MKTRNAWFEAVQSFMKPWFRPVLAMVLGAMGAQAQVTCNWNSAVGGNFSTAGNWNVNTPTNGGSSDYVLKNINSAGMSVTNDFPSPTFLLNGIVETFGAASHYLYGSNLEFRVSNSGALPFINVSAANTYALGIKANITLTTNLLVSGAGGGNYYSSVTFDGVISGVGDITNTHLSSSYYPAIFVNNANNTFTGNWVNLTNAAIAFASDAAIGAVSNKIILDNGAIVGSYLGNITLGAGRQIIVGSGGGELTYRTASATWTLTNANMLAGGGLLRLVSVYGAGHSLTLNAQQPNFTGQVSVTASPCTLTLGVSNALGQATGVSASNGGVISLNNPYGAGTSTITNLANGQIVLGTNLVSSGGTRVYLSDISAINGTDARLGYLSAGNVTVAPGAYPMVIHQAGGVAGISGFNNSSLVYGLGANTNGSLTIGDAVASQWRGLGVGPGASYSVGTSANTLTLSGNAVLDALTGGTLTIGTQIIGGSAANTLGIRGSGTVALTNANNNFASLIQGVGTPTLKAGHTANTMTFKFAPGSNSFGSIANNVSGGSGRTLVLDGVGSTNVMSGNFATDAATTLVLSDGYYYTANGEDPLSGNLEIAGATFRINGLLRFGTAGGHFNMTDGLLVTSNRMTCGTTSSKFPWNANTCSFTINQTGGSIVIDGSTVVGGGHALLLGGTDGGFTNAYYLKGGSLYLKATNDSSHDSLALGADAAGTSLTLFSMTGGKLTVVNRLIRGSQGAGARQVFDFSGGILVAEKVDATNLSSTNTPTVQGTLVNNGGTLAPGDLGISGKTTITGNYTETSPKAVLAVDVGGTTQATGFQAGTYDYLSVSGGAALNGRLSVSLINGYVPPTAATKFTVLTSTGLSGSFANVTGGKVWCADGYSRFDVLTNATANAVVLSNYVVNAWSQAAGGTWANTANWALAKDPDSSDSAAYFGTSLSTSGTVTLDTPRTVRGLTFTNSAASYTLSGAALTLQGDTVTLPKISVLAGSHTISVSLALSNATEIAVAGSSVLTLTGGVTGGQDVTKTGTGLLVLSNVNTLGALALSAGAVRFADGATTVRAFTLAPGTTCDFVAGTLYILKNGGGLDTVSEVTAALSANAFTVRGKTAVPADFSVTEEGSYIKVRAKVKGTIIRFL